MHSTYWVTLQSQLNKKIILASEMKVGTAGIVNEVSDSVHGNRLIEMGCVPGSTIMLQFVAAGKNPMAFQIENSLLAMRKIEADCITVSING